MTSKPLISVIMPAYNVEKYVGEAIESVLAQTVTDFEFIIIDDGSTDNTVDEIKKCTDPRIKLLVNETNRGAIVSLNRAMQEAQGEYIARMDSDDICCFPTRFAVQVEYLKEHPEIFMIGAAHQVMGTDEVVLFPKYDEEIKLQLFRKSVFSHPTIMMRRAEYEAQNFSFRNYLHAEDYAMWAEMAVKGLKLANFEDVYLIYRQHPSQVTRKFRPEQLEVSKKVQRDYFSAMMANVLTKEEIELFKSVPEAKDLPFRQIVLILDKMYRNNTFFQKARWLTFLGHLMYENVSDKKLKMADLLFIFKKRVSIHLISKVLVLYIKQ